MRLLKARHAAGLSGFAAVADDSGLEVEALGGAPGIYSARYAGAGAGDTANNAKLLRELQAYRRSGAGLAIAAYWCSSPGPEDPAPLDSRRRVGGIILDAPRGSGGFGYDPYFWLPDLELTAAELDSADKNRLSHRGRAMRNCGQLRRACGCSAMARRSEQGFRSPCTCTCRGACANARTATSIRIS